MGAVYPVRICKISKMLITLLKTFDILLHTHAVSVEILRLYIYIYIHTYTHSVCITGHYIRIQTYVHIGIQTGSHCAVFMVWLQALVTLDG